MNPIENQERQKRQEYQERQMNQIERIKRMEAILNETALIQKQLSEDVKKFAQVQKRLYCLSEYYGSAEWRKDKEDSDTGNLPKDLECGVLSEDAVYNLLTEYRETVLSMLEAATMYLRGI